jgi:hypothetical protein
LRCLLLLEILLRERLGLKRMVIGRGGGEVVERAGSGSELMVKVVVVLGGEGMIVVLRRRQDGAVALALRATYCCSVGEILVLVLIPVPGVLMLTCGVVERRTTANAILQIRRIGAGAVEMRSRVRGVLLLLVRDGLCSLTWLRLLVVVVSVARLNRLRRT